jgi:hypothetical protein
MRVKGLSAQIFPPDQTARTGQVSMTWSVEILNFFGVMKHGKFQIPNRKYQMVRQAHHPEPS